MGVVGEGEILARFRARVGGVLRRDLGLEAGFAFDVGSAATEILAREGLGGLPDVRAMLARWDIGDRWREVLGRERARAAAEWMAPYTRGAVVDASGDGPAVGLELAELGCEVLAARDVRQSLPREGERPACGTVVLCDVLHREEEPAVALARAKGTGARRVIVIEAVTEEETPPALARLVDAFLEQVVRAGDGARPTGKHRAVEAWLSPGVCAGRVAALERRDGLPGVPLPHALIVADT